MSLQCFVSLHLLCYEAVSSTLYQEKGAVQVQTLVTKIQGDWIQTPPRFASSPDSRKAGEKWTTWKIVLQMAICIYVWKWYSHWPGRWVRWPSVLLSLLQSCSLHQATNPPSFLWENVWSAPPFSTRIHKKKTEKKVRPSRTSSCISCFGEYKYVHNSCIKDLCMMTPIQWLLPPS